VRLRRSVPRTPDEVQEAVRKLGWWYQHFELPSGVWTGDGLPPAYDPRERWELVANHLPSDLEGATVLDVGGNAGYFSLQAMLRGASKCVLVEPIAEFAEQARFVFSQFDVRVDVVVEDVHTYCLTTRKHFDYVLFLGLFYHLRYPLLVLDRLAEMTRLRLLLQSVVVGSEPGGREWPDAELKDVLREDFPRLAFVEHAFRGDSTNWWLPTTAALEALARSAGLRVLAKPSPELLVTEPARELGTLRRRGLVFPELERPIDEQAWNSLLEKRKAPPQQGFPPDRGAEI
jgi:tRNA (mo5U34)-methyltransferase